MKSPGYIFFSIQISSGKIVIEVFVSVIIIIIFKSKIEDSFIFITIFLCKLHHIHLQRHNGLQRHYQIMKERHSSPKFNMETDGNWLVAATSK